MVLLLFLTEKKLICAHTSLFLFLARLLLQINAIIVNDCVAVWYLVPSIELVFLV